MAIPAFLVAAGKGIVAGGKWIVGFCTRHSAGLALASTLSATALTGNVIEGKKKRITFGKSDSMVAGKHSFQVPQIHVEDVRYTKNSSSHRSPSNKGNSNHSQKRSK